MHNTVSYVSTTIHETYNLDIKHDDTYNIIVDFTYEYTMIYNMVKKILRDDMNISFLTKLILEHMFIEYNLSKNEFTTGALAASVEYDLTILNSMGYNVALDNTVNEIDGLFKEHDELILDVLSLISKYYYINAEEYTNYIYAWKYANIEHGAQVEIRCTGKYINFDILF